MYKKSFKPSFKKSFKKKSSTSTRRRLQPTVGAVLTAVGAATKIKRTYNSYKARQTKARNAKSIKSFSTRISQSDNITTSKPIIVGKQRTISFQEKVSRTVRPPLLFKRNYGFSAECSSGRKSMFSIRINAMTNDDLQTDLVAYKSSLLSDTGITDTQIAGQSSADNAQFYVDKLIEKLQMVNSSSNSITGKIHLFAYKRDSGTTYASTSAIIDPVNMLMYYSTQALSTVATGLGGESTVGNGWAFGTGTASNGVNYGAPHNMPGSSINTAGVSAQMDPSLGFSSPQVKDGFNFWFRKVGISSSFSLKPGQQFNSSFIFNDLPIINREEQSQYVFISGVSYIAVVEFKAGIVGDNTAITGDNVISTGSGQLSVIRESTRTLGMKNTLRSKTVLQTAPLAQIAIGSQVIINSDTGVGLAGTVIDP